MGLLEKLKSVLGSGSGRASTDSGEAEVTVEYDPSPESEHAVKGTDEAVEPAAEPDEAVEPAAEPDETAEPTSRETEPETGPDEESPPVDDIKGIGPTYSERLADAGIETVADLASADAGTVAEAAETSPSRAEDWIERAQNR